MKTLIAVLLPAVAAAQLGHEPVLPETGRAMVGVGRAVALTLPGAVRFVAGRADGSPVSAEDPEVGAETGDETFGTYRVRLRPAVVVPGRGFFKVYRLALDAEFVGLAMGGDAEPGLEHDPRQLYRDDRSGVRLSQAYLLAAGDTLALKLGLVRSHFGFGTVANDGEDADPHSVRASPFGFAREGDRNARAQVAVFPLTPGLSTDGRSTRPLTLTVAADAIVDDERARWVDDDRAYQILGGAFVDVADVRAGAGAVYRTQTHEEGGETEVWIAVASARYDAAFDPVALWVEGELAAYFGETTLSQSVFVEDPYTVRAIGGVGRLGTAWKQLEAVVEGGYASGDDNPFDSEVRGFTFDRAYRVGLLMFPEALRAQSAVTAHNIADETFRGAPPRGYDSIPTGGAIQGAVYLNPRVAYTPFPAATLYLGYLYGRTEEAAVDAFRSGVAGGDPVSHSGAVDAHELGHEVDVGVAYTRQFPGVRVRGKAEFAYFAPGEVFADADPMTGAWVQLEAAW